MAKCKQCNNDSGAIYRRDNKEKDLARHQKYRAENKEKIAASNLKYCTENKEKRKRTIRESAMKAYRKDPSKVLNLSHKRREKIKSQYIVSKKEIMLLKSSQCFACNSKENITIDHLIPLNIGGQHRIGNLIPLCIPCNSSKRDLTWTEWKYSYCPRAEQIFRPLYMI